MKRRFNSNQSFVDLLFNVLLGFFMLLMIAIVLVKPQTKKEDIRLKAEYIITMEWPNKSKDDVDLLVMTPLKEVVYYGKKDIKSASLDRDDLGERYDIITLNDGSVLKIEENWEHTTIRKSIKGEYIVNILMFAKRDETPTPVTVKVEKLNPYKLIYSETIVLSSQKEEQTALRFQLNNKGDVVHTSKTQLKISNKIPRYEP